ncbi:MAG: DNA-processing protein DprA [Oscillospiraceae bacterium]|nr:DNA-processing protein DprA [Oscillospiraceae bacterium]
MIDREKWVWLSEALYKGSRKASLLLSRAGSAEKIYSADRAALLSFGVSLTEKELSRLLSKDLADVKKILSDCEKLGIRIVTRLDPEYPARLLEIADAPVLLYVKGRPLSVDDEAAIAIIGTRRASSHGKRAAEKISREIAEGGGVVVSGMARGIDSIAMSCALDAHGYVIGVLGSGIDICYPPENRSLMKRMEREGTLVSEYPPKTKPDKTHFPVRNRIVSALSLASLVIEAPQKSGALITARAALEQNRDVYAVPSGIFESSAEGSNELIRNGATPVMSGFDVLSEYARRFPKKIKLEAQKAPLSAENKTAASAGISLSPEFLASHSPDEQNILQVVSKGAARSDEIASACNMPMAKTLSLLTLLEIRGSIQQLPGSRFEIKTK